MTMETTALSMARSLVRSVVSKAASVAADEMSLLIGVQKEIWFIEDELKTMQAFLRAAEVQKNKDELLHVWAEQVRNLSFDIEDCLDEFKVHVENQSLSKQLLKLRDRHRIAVQIRNLKSRIEEVSSRNTRYNLIVPLPASSIDEEDCYMEDIRNQSANNTDDTGLIGLDTQKSELLQLINLRADGGRTQVIFVVGMGGLGKTTLVKMVYQSAEVAERFRSRAWIIVSQSFNRKELLEDIIKQLQGYEGLKKLMDEHNGHVPVSYLCNYVAERLKDMRYFVVLDDLWSFEALNWIKNVVLTTDNRKGSRIIVTTRDANIAEKYTPAPEVYRLRPLQPDDAKELLLRKINKSEGDIIENNAEEIFGMMLKKCGGLPLAILTVGGVLATKGTKEWKRLYDQLPGELESNPSLQAMRRVVTLSYRYLPYYLKPCFLYMSIFPEDLEIRRERLVYRWIAEGFVGAKAGFTETEVGNSYFDELISRSMIQPSEPNMYGIVASCRLHDIVRDITISISRDENFVSLVGENCYTTIVPANIRHLASYDSENLKQDFDLSRIRSWTLFNEPVEGQATLRLPKFKMLRVLDLEGAEYYVTQKSMDDIVLLCHLKYLHLPEVSFIQYLPRSIGNLHGLQTLKMNGTNIWKLPTEITKLQDLLILQFGNKKPLYNSIGVNAPTTCLLGTMCIPIINTVNHFLPRGSDWLQETRMCSIAWTAEMYKITCSCCTYGWGMRLPNGIEALQKLEILDSVDVTHSIIRAIEGLGKLRKIKELSLIWTRVTKKKCKTLCDALEKLTSLRSLKLQNVKKIGDGTPCWIHSISSPPPLLEHISLKGYIERIPDWVGELTNLVTFELIGATIDEANILKILEALPNLKKLRIFQLSGVAEKLVFPDKGFPKLLMLDLIYLRVVKEVTFEEGTAPLMEKLRLNDWSLDIHGLTHLSGLKEIFLSISVQGEEQRRMIQEQMDVHPNRPALLVLNEEEFWV